MEPTLRYPVGSYVVPGDRLGAVRQQVSGSSNNSSSLPLIQVELQAGPGTYSRGGQIFASKTGALQILGVSQESQQGGDKDDTTAASTSNTTNTNTDSWAVCVRPKPATVDDDDNEKQEPHGVCATQQVIRLGQTVLVRVVRLATQMVTVEILATEHGVLRYDKPAGVIRREDVKPVSAAATTSQQSADPQSATNAALTQFFRPGDWVVAKVLSLGDTRRYFLTTAEPGLGVIHAVSSTSGQPMMPISWKEMECPDTGRREARKCARPPQIPDTLMQHHDAAGQNNDNDDGDGEVPTPMDEGE